MPKFVDKIKGGKQDMYVMPSETKTSVDDFVVTRGNRRAETRQASLLLSI